MTISDERLAPCPFCGAPAELEHGSDHHGEWFNLGCSRHWGKNPDDRCVAGRLWYTETETPEAEAISAWNRRAAPAVPDGWRPSDDQIKRMVDRFLTWRLPDDFAPDGGITFQKIGNAGTTYEYTHEPVGTNLLTATQAEAMVRAMLAASPSPSEKE